MILCIGTSRPKELSSSVRIRGVPLSGLLIEVLTVGATRNSIVIPEQTPLPQLWHEEFHNVFEGLGEEDIALIRLDSKAR